MAREARQTDSEWLPAELLPAADDAQSAALEGAVERQPAEPLRSRLLKAGKAKAASISRSSRPYSPFEDDDGSEWKLVPAAAECDETSQRKPKLSGGVQRPPESEADAPQSERAQAPEMPASKGHHAVIPAPKWAPVGPSAPAPVPPGTVDLNEATFDQLRRLGLSFHQAAGVIGRREQRGGFHSLDELDELAGAYGLAPEEIAALKQAASA